MTNLSPSDQMMSSPVLSFPADLAVLGLPPRVRGPHDPPADRQGEHLGERQARETVASAVPPFHCCVPYWKVPNRGMGSVYQARYAVRIMGRVVLGIALPAESFHGGVMPKSHKKRRAETAAQESAATDARAARSRADAAAAEAEEARTAAAQADARAARKAAAAVPAPPPPAAPKKARHVRPPRREAAAKTTAAATAAGRALTGGLAKALTRSGGKRAANQGRGPRSHKRHPVPVSQSPGRASP
jgi:hypothetical protein